MSCFQMLKGTAISVGTSTICKITEYCIDSEAIKFLITCRALRGDISLYRVKKWVPFEKIHHIYKFQIAAAVQHVYFRTKKSRMRKLITGGQEVNDFVESLPKTVSSLKICADYSYLVDKIYKAYGNSLEDVSPLLYIFSNQLRYLEADISTPHKYTYQAKIVYSPRGSRHVYPPVDQTINHIIVKYLLLAQPKLKHLVLRIHNPNKRNASLIPDKTVHTIDLPKEIETLELNQYDDHTITSFPETLSTLILSSGSQKDFDLRKSNLRNITILVGMEGGTRYGNRNAIATDASLENLPASVEYLCIPLTGYIAEELASMDMSKFKQLFPKIRQITFLCASSTYRRYIVAVEQFDESCELVQFSFGWGNIFKWHEHIVTDPYTLKQLLA